MALAALDERDIDIVAECLACVASGGIIEHDSECSTLFGMDFSRFKSIAAAWPRVDAERGEVDMAVINSLNNLLGYPHGRERLWSKFISVSPDDVRTVLEKCVSNSSPSSRPTTGCSGP